jgi:DNA polymerase-3 subunit alpha
MKILVKEGWTNQDTGKKPNLNSICLGAVFTRRLGDLCKEINCVAQYKDLEAEFIHKLGHLFYDNKGDNQVSFEIMELEKVKKLVETVPEIDENEEAFLMKIKMTLML